MCSHLKCLPNVERSSYIHLHALLQWYVYQVAVSMIRSRKVISGMSPQHEGTRQRHQEPLDKIGITVVLMIQITHETFKWPHLKEQEQNGQTQDPHFIHFWIERLQHNAWHRASTQNTIGNTIKISSADTRALETISSPGFRLPATARPMNLYGQKALPYIPCLLGPEEIKWWQLLVRRDAPSSKKTYTFNTMNKKTNIYV